MNNWEMLVIPALVLLIFCKLGKIHLVAVQTASKSLLAVQANEKMENKVNLMGFSFVM